MFWSVNVRHRGAPDRTGGRAASVTVGWETHHRHEVSADIGHDANQDYPAFFKRVLLERVFCAYPQSCEGWSAPSIS